MPAPTAAPATAPLRGFHSSAATPAGVIRPIRNPTTAQQKAITIGHKTTSIASQPNLLRESRRAAAEGVSEAASDEEDSVDIRVNREQGFLSV